ncbi:GGDEF domain-containing protein [Sulfurimonas autotrophica]|uniref:diguanylate cyclase n=1 Tax=Sulfurimonas autotrophica (strain ATCC BAA-671 / DSM 16294 / JCM 11897 / OK10) TaxID=563040 RepID=E0UU44_SULAO|nr:GGDEF domain-containing protein [Sulfurimonas autotrophica]ADN08353.1 diguanylate cyclase [Sulfurimonas autotrophica DSM 16294]
MNKILDFLTLERGDDFCNRRYIVIKFALLSSIVLFSLFIFINLFMHQYKASVIDFISAFVAIFAYIYMQNSKNIILTIRIATFNIVIFFLIFAYISQAEHFSLIWTIFVPIFAIITNGKRVGLYFSLLFYAILFVLSYHYINVWDSGQWLFTDWMRLVLASTVLTLCMYIYEALLDKAQQDLQRARAKELQRTKELHLQSITDQLTGLYNRRYYDNMIVKLAALAKRQNLCITFFILDIDYFKLYNDNYGHIQGDEALIEVAQVLKKHIQRGDDFVFRLGGEEFAGIILSKEKQKAQQWASQLTKIIEDLKIEHRTSKISEFLTVSIGIATLSHPQENNIGLLYKDADKALYTAKYNGRNQSQISQESN